MRTPLYRDAQRRLRHYVLSNGLKPGDALPPEGQLARELGISRLSLREATKSLESLGVVKAVAGKGLFVSAFTFEAILEQLPYSIGINGASLTELLQVREAMEAGLIAPVARLMTEDDLTELNEIVDAMKHTQSRDEPTAEIDRQFHLRLFEPLANGLVTSLIDLFWELFHSMEKELPPGDQHSVEVHRDILTAVRTQDPARMVMAVHDHFDGIREALRRNPDAATGR